MPIYLLDKNKNAGSSVAFLHFYYNFRSSVSLLCRLAICKGAGVGILLEYLMEVVCVTESDLVRDVRHRHIGFDEILHRLIDSQAVYVINGSLAYTVLKHLDKVIVGYVDDLGEMVDVDLLLKVLCHVIDDRNESHNVVIDHSVAVIARVAIATKY